MKWLTLLDSKVKTENQALLRHNCVDHCILLLKHVFNHINFTTNGFKGFSWTNSTDPRQCVPLNWHSISQLMHLIQCWFWFCFIYRRSKHTAVAYKDAIYVFGGDNGWVCSKQVDNSLVPTLHSISYFQEEIRLITE